MATLTPQGLLLFHEALLPDWQVGLPFFCPLGTQSSELLMALLSAFLWAGSSSAFQFEPAWTGGPFLEWIWDVSVSYSLGKVV